MKETVTAAHWSAAILGFIGIIILLRPSEINWFGIAVLISAFMFAINQLVLRKLTSTESPIVTLMLYNVLSMPLVLLIVLVQGIEAISLPLVAIAVLSNVFLLSYQWFCALAYRQAQASQIVVAEYTGLLFCVFFDEWLDGLSWVGTGFIVLPSLIVPWVQAQIGQKKFIKQNAG